MSWAELIPVAVVSVVGVAFWATVPLRDYLATRRMRLSNYIVFEADRMHLDDLSADMTRAGWKLASSEGIEGTRSLFRFEKSRRDAPAFGKFEMLRTAKRTRGADLIIRIAEHGVA